MKTKILTICACLTLPLMSAFAAEQPTTQTPESNQWYDGMYVGFSLGRTVFANGGMKADYTNFNDSHFVPGSFKQSEFKANGAKSVQFSIGKNINNDVRADISYLRYSGMSMPNMVFTGDGKGGFFSVPTAGGNIDSHVTMLNIYYSLDPYTNGFFSGNSRPYVGAGIGLGINTISDYLIYDMTYYSKIPFGSPNTVFGNITGTSDRYAHHIGGTTISFAFALEGGVTSELPHGLKLDIFARLAHLGNVRTNGNIVVSETHWLSTGNGILIGEKGSEIPADYGVTYFYQGWRESGTLSVLDLGLRLRYQF